jgi:hypothetical protein
MGAKPILVRKTEEKSASQPNWYKLSRPGHAGAYFFSSAYPADKLNEVRFSLVGHNSFEIQTIQAEKLPKLIWFENCKGVDVYYQGEL